MIYFDTAATTKPNQEVLDTYLKVNQQYWYNPSNLYKPALLAADLINQATKNIKELLGLTKKDIIYTSGATEANNLAIRGLCNAYLNQNKEIITTEIEHPSVYNTIKEMESLGFKVTYLKCKNGAIDLEDLRKALTKDTILVSIMWVNNIIGSINNIKEIITIVKNYSHAKLHVDMVQGITKIKPDFDLNLIDLFTISLHKIEGLKGIGLLIKNQDMKFLPILYGGHQQDSIRPGTMDPALIVSAAKALRLNLKSQEENYQYVNNLYQYLSDELIKIPHLIINKKDGNYSPYILSISFKNLKGETAMHYLEQNDIYVGIGSACNEKTKNLERAILALDNDPTRAINMIRISLSVHNTKDEINLLINKINEIGK